MLLSDVPFFIGVEPTDLELVSDNGRRGVTTGLRPATSSRFLAKAAFLAWVLAKSFYKKCFDVRLQI